MKQRVLTACLLIPPVLLAVFLSSPWPIFALGVLVVVVGHIELTNLSGERVPFPIVGIVAACWTGLILILSQVLEGGESGPGNGHPFYSDLGKIIFPWSIVGVCAVGVSGCILIVRSKRGFLATQTASLWLAGGVAGLLELKLLDYGQSSLWSFGSPLLLALIPLWIGDTAAIFAGRAWGQHLLAPKISPKKTVEGGIANLLGCIAGAVGVAFLIHQPLLVGILVGISTGILGQAGDLLESAMKRSAGVKDSGNLLPGHGGILDRIDSILLSAPVVALIVVTMGGG